MRIDGSMNVIDFGTRKITYNLHREDRKRLRIVVAPELTVDVFAPATADEEQIHGKMLRHCCAPWRCGTCTADPHHAQALGKLQPQRPYHT